MSTSQFSVLSQQAKVDAAGRRCYEAFTNAAQEFLPPSGAPKWETLSAPIREAWMAAAAAAMNCLYELP